MCLSSDSPATIYIAVHVVGNCNIEADKPQYRKYESTGLRKPSIVADVIVLVTSRLSSETAALLAL